MSIPALKNIQKATPTYLGSKWRLMGWIFKSLEKVLPANDFQHLTLLDAFCGGGAISFTAKALGFQQVFANDWSFRTQVIAKALLENQSVFLSREELLYLAQPLSQEIQPGFIEAHYCPSVFSTRHARVLDQVLYGSQKLQCPIKKALTQLLLWHLVCEFVAFPTSIGTSNRPFAEALDGLRDLESLNPKRFQDGSIQNLLRPTWSVLKAKQKLINAGIFRGSPVNVFQQDALEFIRQTQGDILYADPPYAGTVSYEKTNRVLDSLLRGEVLPTCDSSAFTQGVEALNPLFESARHIPVWVLSYGNKQLSLEELVALVKAHAPEREIQGYAKAYTHLSHVSKTQGNQELLVIASPKKGVFSFDPRS